MTHCYSSCVRSDIYLQKLNYIFVSNVDTVLNYCSSWVAGTWLWNLNWMAVWVLYTDIINCNMWPDSVGCYGRFGSLVSHQKNVFMTVTTVRWKLRNAADYDLWNMPVDAHVVVTKWHVWLKWWWDAEWWWGWWIMWWEWWVMASVMSNLTGMMSDG